MNELQYLNRNGGTVLLSDGYQYYKHKVYKNRSRYVLDLFPAINKCMGSIKTSAENITKKNVHTCRQDYNKNELDLCVNSKQLDDVPIPQIYQSVVGSLQDKGIDTVTWGGGTNNCTNIITLAYALLSDKTKCTYEMLFHLIKTTVVNWKPEKYKTDYEEAAMQAVLNVFPEIDLHGCYYHYNKSVWRKGKEFGLTSEKLTRRIIALCAVLPLLPYNKVMNGWDYIKRESLEVEKEEGLQNFFEYFENYWLHSEEFIKIWTVFGERHRTTKFLVGILN